MATATLNDGWNVPLFDRIRGMADSFTQRLMETTSLTSPQAAKNPFRNPAGVAAALPKFRADERKVIAPVQTSMFSVDEAKKRVSGFIEKSHTLTSLIDALKTADLSLKTLYQKGKVFNILMDDNSKGFVDAAKVSPKLSKDETNKLRIAERLGVNDATIPGMRFKEWSILTTTLSAQGEGYTISNNKAYIGTTFAESFDRRPVAEIVAEAKKSGVELILPTVDGTANSPRVDGMPFLVKHESLLASKVHTGLGHDALAKSWNKTLIESIEGKAKRKASSFGMDGVENTSGFDVGRFIKKQPQAVAPKVDNSSAFNFADFDDIDEPTPTHDNKMAEAYDYQATDEETLDLEQRRDFSIRVTDDLDAQFVVYDNDIGEVVDIPLDQLLEGQYKLENKFGVVGYAEVSPNGVQHYDMDGNKISIQKPTPDIENVYDEDEKRKFGR